MNFKQTVLTFFVLGALTSAYLCISSYLTHREVTALAKQGITERLSMMADKK